MPKFPVFREFRTTNNETDIAIQPAAGIKPKRLQVDEVKPDPRRKWLSCATDIDEMNIQCDDVITR